VNRVARIDFDHNATTRPAPEVVEAMLPFLGEAWGNASSVHVRGEAAREAVETARARVAGLIGAAPEEIVFVSSGSESDNLAVKGACLARPERRHLVISTIEHPAVLEAAAWLEREGWAVSRVPVTAEGIVEPDAVARALRPDTALVSVMLVNNEVGTVQPVAEIAALARSAGALMHTDAVQAVGKIPVDVGALGADLLSLAGHKFHGPLGAAALYVRRRTRLIPLVHGGRQERGKRAGTENLPAVVGLGAAAERAARALAAGLPRRAESLGDRLLDGLLDGVPATRLNGHRLRRVRSTVNVRFDGVDGEAVLHALDGRGFSVSTGAACSSGEKGPSHVLLAMGLRPEDAHASVRFSLGEDNTEDEVERALAETPAVVEEWRALHGTGAPARGGTT
jgi:cysteine desulfurase